jgi:lysophospholipid acyltransferase (LPLAT)-like uncharacterized protein
VRKITWGRKLLANLLYLWIKSLRIDKKDYPEKPFLFIIWHEDTFAGIKYISNNLPLTVAASDSNDGNITNHIMTKLGFDVLRGSSHKKANKTLIGLIKSAKEKNSIALTIDGPKGPRHIPKLGIFIVAQKSNLPIYAARFSVKGHRINSMWDKLFVPYPFAKVKVFLSEPIFVKSSTDKDQREKYLNQAIQQSIDVLNNTLK